eukprot:jgi/Botrbrau1/22103/Bobra.0206s0029.1
MVSVICIACMGTVFSMLFWGLGYMLGFMSLIVFVVEWCLNILLMKNVRVCVSVCGCRTVNPSPI